jgi:hypothetical protein
MVLSAMAKVQGLIDARTRRAAAAAAVAAGEDATRGAKYRPRPLFRISASLQAQDIVLQPPVNEVRNSSQKLKGGHGRVGGRSLAAVDEASAPF